MNLVIDIGNTRSKVFLFKGDQMKHESSFQKLSVTALNRIFNKYSIEKSILSSVINHTALIKSFLKKKTDFIELKSTTPLPFRNLYQSPKTLGNDRIANAAGAVKMFPGKNCLVVDAGTCVKYDFINGKKEYLGGAISPGMTMRFRSMHAFTARLPFENPSDTLKLIGTTTKESIVSGVQLGMLHEMQGYISAYQKKYKNLQVILTGGDAHCFAHLFNFPIFAAPQLTATGLNEILQHNYQEK